MNQKRDVETRTAQLDVCSLATKGAASRGRSVVENFIAKSVLIVDPWEVCTVLGVVCGPATRP